MSARPSMILPDALFRPEGRFRHTAAWLVRLVLLTALGSPFLAPTFAGASDDPPAYRVAPGDRINIIVFGQTELSGESVIDGAHTVTVPLIGPVSVRGLSVKDIELRITQRLSEGYVQKPVVSVRLTEPRPIYVVGDVKTSGSYAYRHGISVMGAVALAGGFTVSEERAQAVLRTEFLQADERVQTLEIMRISLLARRMRLEAQRDGRSSPDFGELTDPDAPGELLAQTVKGEAQMHAFQTAELQQQIEMLEQQAPKLEAGKRFLGDQLVAERRQLELIGQNLVEYNKLSSGLARRYTVIELQREEARNRGNIARFSGEMSNLEISLGELKIRIQGARDTFQRRVITELQETLLRIAENEAALSAARTTRELRLRQVGFVEDVGMPRRALFVTRNGEQKSETFAVTDGTLLDPGDILRVERLPDSPPSTEPASITWR